MTCWATCSGRDESSGGHERFPPPDQQPMKTYCFQLAFAALTLCLCGCVGTSLDGNLKSPAYHGGAVQKVAVVAVTDQVLVREGFENRFARQMIEHGQGALVTYDLLSLPEIKADKQAAVTRVRQAGADSVLLIRLANQSTRSTETQATAPIFAPVPSAICSTNAGSCWTSGKMHRTAPACIAARSSVNRAAPGEAASPMAMVPAGVRPK